MKRNKLTRSLLLASFLFTIFATTNFAVATAANVSVVTIAAPTATTYTLNPITFYYTYYTNSTDGQQVVALLNGTAIQTTNPYTNNTAVTFGSTVMNGDWNLTVYAKDNVLNSVTTRTQVIFTVNEYSQTATATMSSVLSFSIILIIIAGLVGVILQKITGTDTFWKYVVLGIFIILVIMVLIIIPFLFVH